MIDPNAKRKMNFGAMLDYVRQNPASLADGSFKNPMARPGMPPTRPMMMARAGGYDPMGAPDPGANYGGAPTANAPGTGPSLSAPAPAAPTAPSVSNNANAPNFGFDHFGQTPTGPSAIDTAFGMFAGGRPGLTPADLQAYAASRATPTPTTPQNINPVAMAKAASLGLARGQAGNVNAAGVAGGPAAGSDPFGYGGFANNGYGSMGYGVTPGGFAGYDAIGNPVSAGSAQDVQGGYAGGAGGAAGGTGKIVCTAMNQDYGFGSFRQAIWLRHSAGLHPAYERGYHAMFRPLLAYGRKRSTLAQRAVMAALEDIARMRTFDIRREARAGFWRGLNRGRLYRAVLEPLCFIVGLMNAGR